ncbi:MAG: hypothetical protein AB1665_01675 [Candidatus Thermoplasmatota archaeon]
MLSVQERLRLACDWFFHSGIQNSEGFLTGSVNAWYRKESRHYSFAHSEVTGYAITTCAYLGEDYLERAISGAEWLIKSAGNSGAFMCRYANGVFERHLCTFDNGIILNALVNLFRLTKKERYLRAAEKCAEWLLTMQNDDGSMHARQDCATSEILRGNRWSAEPGSFHSKVAIGLLNIARALGNDEYEEKARKLCTWALKRQQPDGRFITDSATGGTYLHAHCYSIEGILAIGTLVHEDKYVRAALRGIEWMKNAILETGGLSMEWNRSFSTEEHVDSIAQAFRLFLLTDRGEDMREQLLKHLCEFQQVDGEKREKGGFHYTITGECARRDLSAHGTLFAIQALKLAMDMKSRENFNWFLYV